MDQCRRVGQAAWGAGPPWDTASRSGGLALQSELVPPYGLATPFGIRARIPRARTITVAAEMCGQ